MKFIELSKGYVSKRQAGTATAIAAGSRCVVTGDRIICTFMLQSKLGINDFMTMSATSTDGGITWSEPAPVWPELHDRYSIFFSISQAPSGDLFLYGIRMKIDAPGETFWSEATMGIKQNDLVWARSSDAGRTWSAPAVIPMPVPGSAEAPGPVCVTRSGRWLVCYAPYNTFDPKVRVDRSRIVLLYSDDQGKTWNDTSMLRFKEPESSGAEAWVIELADGQLLGTCWHVSDDGKTSYPNAYALSTDGGKTWPATLSTGIMGQSTALTALPDGRALFIYNQRKHGEVGVWLAVVRPTKSDFGVESNQIVWRAETATQHASSADHVEWQDFAFGEPSIVALPDGTFLVTLWCAQPSGQGVMYVKLKAVE